MYGTAERAGGFTLMELMAAVAVLAVLTVIAYPSFQNQVRRARLYDAQAAMIDNVKALEKHYMHRFSYKKSSTEWADLPETRTKYFCIHIQGNPRGTNKGEDGYTLKAVAFDKAFEPRVLLMDADQKVMVCESSISVCPPQDKDAKGKNVFFANPARADKNCTVW